MTEIMKHENQKLIKRELGNLVRNIKSKKNESRLAATSMEGCSKNEKKKGPCGGMHIFGAVVFLFLLITYNMQMNSQLAKLNLLLLKQDIKLYTQTTKGRRQKIMRHQQINFARTIMLSSWVRFVHHAKTSHEFKQNNP